MSNNMYAEQINAMTGNKLTTAVHRLCGKELARFTWWLNRSNPNSTLLHNDKDKNADYFSIHKEDIEKIKGFLDDELSRQTYDLLIKYRSTHNLRYQPIYRMSNQYFVRDIVRLTDREVFVDCGAFTGDTIRKFQKESKNRYSKIVAFEPSIENSKRIENGDSRITVIRSGAWDKNEKVPFVALGPNSAITGQGEKVDSKPTYEVDCKRIDDCDECKDASFIKMDIEGAELPALKGAWNVIQSNRPKLAICIYHTPMDMVQIPLFLHAGLSDYKFYVRHHSRRCAETVFYAIPLELTTKEISR